MKSKTKAIENAYAFANAKLKTGYHVQVVPDLEHNLIMVNYNEMSKRFKYDPPLPVFNSGIVGYAEGELFKIVKCENEYYACSRMEIPYATPFVSDNFKPLPVYAELEKIKDKYRKYRFNKEAELEQTKEELKIAKSEQCPHDYQLLKSQEPAYRNNLVELEKLKKVLEDMEDGQEIGKGLQLVIDERKKQIQKGWTLDHDRDHKGGALAIHAAELAVNGTDVSIDGSEAYDAWGLVDKYGYPEPRSKALTIACALLIAELESVISSEGILECEATIKDGKTLEDVNKPDPHISPKYDGQMNCPICKRRFAICNFVQGVCATCFKPENEST